jgi:tape measure domain-containing protein
MAATDLERLVVRLSADIRGYENALKKAQGATNRQLGTMQKKALASSTAISGAFIRAGAQIATAFAAGQIVQNAAQLTDASIRISNSLKVAGLSGAELEKVYKSLNKAAIENGAPIETLAALYSKASQAQKELGVSSDELTTFANNVAVALRVAGTDAQAASGALQQLGQALGSGKVQAEEFSSILDGAPTIAQAAAAGLLEAGGSVSKLKALVVDGKVSSEAFFRAFEAGAPMLKQQVASSVFTLQQSATNLWTALLKVTKEFDASTGASGRFTGGINNAARAINEFDVKSLIDKISEAKGSLDGFLNDLGNASVFKDLNEFFGVTDGTGQVINVDAEAAKQETASLEKEVKLLQERIKLNTSLEVDNTAALARLAEVQKALAAVKASAAGIPDTVPSYSVTENGVKPTSITDGLAPLVYDRFSPPAATGPVKPVSLRDFTPPSSKGGGSGKAKKEADDYTREIEQIRERTAALTAETEAQSKVNPLVDDFGFAIEKARAAHDLLTAAEKQGLAITPELKASIDQLATGYANASVAAEKLGESQDRSKQKAEEMRDFQKDLTRGIIDGFVQGKKAADIFADALSNIGNKLLDMSLDSIFAPAGNKSSGGIGSILGSIFGFANGGFTGRGGKYDPAGIVHKGEYVMDAASTKRIGVDNLQAMQAGRMPTLPSIPRKSGGAVSVSVPIQIDATGADSAGLARVERQIAQLKADLPAQVVASVKNAQKRRTI